MGWVQTDRMYGAPELDLVMNRKEMLCDRKLVAKLEDADQKFRAGEPGEAAKILEELIVSFQPGLKGAKLIMTSYDQARAEWLLTVSHLDLPRVLPGALPSRVNLMGADWQEQLRQQEAEKTETTKTLKPEHQYAWLEKKLDETQRRDEARQERQERAKVQAAEAPEPLDALAPAVEQLNKEMIDRQEKEKMLRAHEFKVKARKAADEAAMALLRTEFRKQWDQYLLEKQEAANRIAEGLNKIEPAGIAVQEGPTYFPPAIVGDSSGAIQAQARAEKEVETADLSTKKADGWELHGGWKSMHKGKPAKPLNLLQDNAALTEQIKAMPPADLTVAIATSFPTPKDTLLERVDVMAAARRLADTMAVHNPATVGPGAAFEAVVALESYRTMICHDYPMSIRNAARKNAIEKVIAYDPDSAALTLLYQEIPAGS